MCQLSTSVGRGPERPPQKWLGHQNTVSVPAIVPGSAVPGTQNVSLRSPNDDGRSDQANSDGDKKPGENFAGL